MNIAIVSTYKIECGIARFSEILEKNLNINSNVTVFALPPQELKKSFGGTAESAKNFIDSLCEKLKSFDAVSLQCEYSLFADSLSVSVSRIKKILSANANSTITLHTLITRGSGAEVKFPSLISWLAHPKSTLRGFYTDLRKAVTAKTEVSLLEFIKANKIKVIVHTESTKKVLMRRYGLLNVDCHPLCYTSEKDKLEFDHSLCRQELGDKLKLDSSDKLVGVFGFFGKYKGFDYAINCISRLSDDYKLLVFSGFHPNSIRALDTSQVDNLIMLAKKRKVLDRVFFMGSVDDTAMYKAIAGVDFSWLPYRETGQEASAICSEVAELSKRMVISRNFAFIDYMKFNLRNDYEFFEVGNVEELRLKTSLYDSFHFKSNGKEVVLDHAGLQTKFYLEMLKREVRTEN